MLKDDKLFCRVDVHILPEAIKKTIRAKELLRSGSCKTINEAIKAVGISRSAYYKYKDHVAPAFDENNIHFKVICIAMQEDFVLFSKLLRKINREKNTVISLSSNRLSSELIALTIIVNSDMLQEDFNRLIQELKDIKGIHSLTVQEEGLLCTSK